MARRRLQIIRGLPINTDRRHIVVGLSGGVDSAVAAWLLREQGHQVTGLFMKNWEEDDGLDYCAAAEDHAIARTVCEQLDLPLKTVNFATEYWDQVFTRFLSDSAAGRTPNPDVLCNREIKFKAFLEHALTLGADCIATGHYARVSHTDGHYQLLKGQDKHKDQSYFLYSLGQGALAKSVFPLGEMTKPRVRALAQKTGLTNYDRKDSTGICFIGERPFKAFLGHYLPPRPGDIRTLGGESRGQHDGLMYYTIGQRHGLSIGGPGEPWYVVQKDLARNILYVVQGHDHPALFDTCLQASDVNWISGHRPELPLRCHAKIRYRQAEQMCVIEKLDDDSITVRFAEPQRAITPGQSVVFYDNEICLGGGVIAAIRKHDHRLQAAHAQ